MTEHRRDCIVCGGTGWLKTIPDGVVPINLAGALAILEPHPCLCCKGEGSHGELAAAQKTEEK